MILALAGVYGTLTFVANCITTKYLTDQWGRRKSVIPHQYIYIHALLTYLE